MAPTPWRPPTAPEGLLEEDVRAPVPVPGTPVESYGEAFRALLEDLEVPSGTLEAAVRSSSVFLHGIQTILGAANRMISGDSSASEVQSCGVVLLQTFTVLLQESRAAYVLRQVAEALQSRTESASGRPPLKSWRRLKDCMTPLETRLERLGVPGRMEVPRLASLLVHLDDLYDDSSLQLQRFYGLVELERAEARRVLPEFLRRLHAEFIRGSISDHLLGGVSGGGSETPAEGSGLVSLIPELVRALE